MRCFLSGPSAGRMRSVWKAAQHPLSSDTFWAPCSLAFAFNASIAREVPDSTKPQGKRRFPSLHVPPVSAAASSHMASTSSSPSPTTEIIFCASCPSASTAAFMNSPLSLANLTPSSNEKHFAAQSAASSPQDTPAAAAASPLFFPSWSLSHSRPHIAATKIAGWQTSSWQSFSSGPISVTSNRSYPSTSLAFWIIGHAFSCSSAQPSMPSRWEPCPGKSSAKDGGWSFSTFLT
mmetsp:Transcript_71692/g.214002  ORF Transcript_71692/g.214002 Transcript_71692/m.214002 type:complete len:234 (-) Transcript_71692:655-1356(-)